MPIILYDWMSAVSANVMELPRSAAVLSLYCISGVPAKQDYYHQRPDGERHACGRES